MTRLLSLLCCMVCLAFTPVFAVEAQSPAGSPSLTGEPSESVEPVADPTVDETAIEVTAETIAYSPLPWGKRISFALVGSVIVLITLSAMWLISAGVGSVFAVAAERQRRRQQLADAAAESAAMAKAVAVALTLAEEDNDELPIAAIAAAIAVCIEQPHRIVHIRPQSQGRMWTQVGRQDQFSSHRLR